jgi:uncharacterized membrane protein (DUF485 family)
MQDEKISLIDRRTTDLLKEIWGWQREHDTEVRSHFRGLFVLAGALCAFSMPLLSTPLATVGQKVSITIAICAFLMLILVGTIRMAYILRDQDQALRDIRAGLDSKDEDALTRYRNRESKLRKEREYGDAFGTAVHTLFALGLIFLFLAVVLGLSSFNDVPQVLSHAVW